MTAAARLHGPGSGPIDDSLLPAEWCPHHATWLAWPSDESLWGEHLEPARCEVAALCQAIGGGAGAERLEILVRDERDERDAARHLSGLDARFHRARYWDIWLRDTGPLFVRARDGNLTALRFRFNGWGEKYHFPDDDEVAETIARISGSPLLAVPLVCEGGAVEVDGEGTCLTTSSCVLHRNRNPGLVCEQVAALFSRHLGVAGVIWLKGCLVGDHTDGHVDTLARFVRPGVVVCMDPCRGGDPNHDVLENVARQLGKARDANGRRLEIVRVPSPGAVLDDDGTPLPASYLNFYVANAAVVVPVYGTAYDEEAVKAIAACFVDRPVVGLPARHILTGGGAFHCITRQEPEPLDD